MAFAGIDVHTVVDEAGDGGDAFGARPTVAVLEHGVVDERAGLETSLVIVEGKLPQVAADQRRAADDVPGNQAAVEPVLRAFGHRMDRPEQLGRRHLALAQRDVHVHERTGVFMGHHEFTTRLAGEPFALEVERIHADVPVVVLAIHRHVTCDRRHHERLAEDAGGVDRRLLPGDAQRERFGVAEYLALQRRQARQLAAGVDAQAREGGMREAQAVVGVPVRANIVEGAARAPLGQPARDGWR